MIPAQLLNFWLNRHSSVRLDRLTPALTSYRDRQMVRKIYVGVQYAVVQNIVIHITDKNVNHTTVTQRLVYVGVLSPGRKLSVTSA